MLHKLKDLVDTIGGFDPEITLIFSNYKRKVTSKNNLNSNELNTTVLIIFARGVSKYDIHLNKLDRGGSK